jgi:maltose O-acetyltransferase
MLGDNCKIARDTVFGCDVLMGPDVIIMSATHEFEDPATPIEQQGAKPVRPVTIGNDVWLGARVIVMPGVTISEGAVIGAGSVVTRDIPAFGVAAGVPARVFRKRGDRFLSKAEESR